MPRQLLPEVDSRRCTSCGDCVVVCPTHCLEFDAREQVILIPQSCINCSVCEAICAPQAILMQLADW